MKAVNYVNDVTIISITSSPAIIAKPKTIIPRTSATPPLDAASCPSSSPAAIHGNGYLAWAHDRGSMYPVRRSTSTTLHSFIIASDRRATSSAPYEPKT